MAAGCNATLPDAQSAGAAVYRDHCAGCHRLYAPGSMTAAMWQYQVARMRSAFALRGLPWLAPGEERTLLDYLTRHAGTS